VFSNDAFPALGAGAGTVNNSAPAVAATLPDANAAPGWQPDANPNRTDIVVKRMTADLERYRKEGYKLF
jgi:hypothetical protein